MGRPIPAQPADELWRNNLPNTLVGSDALLVVSIHLVGLRSRAGGVMSVARAPTPPRAMRGVGRVLGSGFADGPNRLVSQLATVAAWVGAEAALCGL